MLLSNACKIHGCYADTQWAASRSLCLEGANTSRARTAPSWHDCVPHAPPESQRLQNSGCSEGTAQHLQGKDLMLRPDGRSHVKVAL